MNVNHGTKHRKDTVLKGYNEINDRVFSAGDP